MPGKLQLSVRAALLGVLTLSAVSAFVSAGQQRWLAQNYRPQPINQQRGHGYYGPAAPKYADSYDSEANNPEIFLQYKNEDDEIPLDLALAEKGKTLPEGEQVLLSEILDDSFEQVVLVEMQKHNICNVRIHDSSCGDIVTRKNEPAAAKRAKAARVEAALAVIAEALLDE